MKIYSASLNANPREKARLRAIAAQQIQSNGVEVRPFPPRSLQVQSGSRKVLLTWNGPADSHNVASYRVYRDTESNLYAQIADPSCRQCEVSCSAGSPSPTYNFFVSCVSTFGRESGKVQIQGAALTEAAAPADPAPPPKWTSEPQGGGGARGTQGGDYADRFRIGGRLTL